MRIFEIGWFRYLSLIFSVYVATMLFGGSFQPNGGIVCILGSSMWVAIAMFIFPPFKNKPIEDRED